MKIEDVLNALQGGSNGVDTVDSLTKAWLTTTGIVNYDLERPAKATYPVLTPIRNEMPRMVSGMGDTATRWKTVTAIDTAHVPIGLSEGQRGGVISTTVADRVATYVTWGLEDFVTYQANWAAEGFDDVLALAIRGLLESVMIAEEKMILGGNSSVALGTTATPVGTGATTGGALSDGTYFVGCVALTMDGQRLATVATGIVQNVTRTNADGTVDTIPGGTARPSAQSSGVTLNAGTAVQKITATVTAVQGAVAYAWYLGSSATLVYLQQITSINSVAFTTALVTTTQNFVALAATDYSRLNTFSYDGLMYATAFTSTSGAYYRALATGTAGVGTVLTSDGAGGVAEIETALQAFWDNYRLSPDTIWVSGQEAKAINKLVIANGGAPLIRLNASAKETNGDFTAGSGTGSYYNKFTNTVIRIRLHPNMPAGTIFFTSQTVPYPHPGFGAVARLKLRRDYFQVQWPIRTLKYEYGVYADGVLQVYFLPAYGAITNIGPT